MKIWFFVEGSSEQSMIEVFMRLLRPEFRKCNDLVNFVKNKELNSNYFYIYNCEDVSSIPFKIGDPRTVNWIIESDAKAVVVVCDLEKLPCFGSRTSAIISQIKDQTIVNRLKMIINKPCIESIYLQFPAVVDKVIKKLPKSNDNKQKSINCPQGVTTNFQGVIKDICKENDVRYRKGFFAENFFSILCSKEFQGEIANNLILLRLKNIIESISAKMSPK